MESLGQRLITRRPLSRFIQIDRLVAVLTGAGTQTTPAFYLPHARYSVFVDAEPVRAARSFALLDDASHGVTDDWSLVADDIGNVPVPLVQHELPAGTYRMTIEASPTCTWRAQVVLNSMQSWAAPPPAWRPSLPPPERIMLGSGRSPTFRIEQTGTYTTDFMIDGFRGQHGVRQMKPICPSQLALRAANGHVIPLAAGTGQKATWPTSQFLGAGDWQVEMETQCEWELVIRPMVGPSGGGAYWF